MKTNPIRLEIDSAKSSFTGLLAGVLLCGLPLNAAEFDEPILLESPNAQSRGWFGAEGVDWVPDVNGDGVSDIVVGALGEMAEAGRVYVFDGKTRKLLTQLQSPFNAALANFGAKVAGIADLNGNGSGDVIVATGSGQNRVYVLDGATGESIHTFDGRGRSISAVPDVNSDGLPEIVVGYHINPNSFGYARIYDGATGSVLTSLHSPNGTWDFFGWAVSGLADVNGNGGGDVIVGDWGADGERGRAYTFDGTTGRLLHKLMPTLEGRGQFGRSVAGLGDINGDGRGDLVVGAAGVMGNGAYIFDGATGEALRVLKDPVRGNGLAWIVSALQDVTGDALSDVVASGYIPSSLGNAYVFDASTGVHLITLPGNKDFGGGDSIVGIPDVNGDGLGEVLVANYSATSSSGWPNAGHVLLYLSKAPEPLPALQIVGMTIEGFTLRVTPHSQSAVSVEATSNFTTWEKIATVPLGSNPVMVPDSNALNHPRRFYRAVKSN